MNQCNLHGRLAADPELRYTNNGKAVCNFTLAVDDGYGKYKNTEFIKIVIWGKAGKAAAKYLEKGRQVIVPNGTLRIKKREKNGNKYINPEIHARSVKFLSSDKGKKKIDDDIDKTESNKNIEDDLDDEEAPF